MFACNFFSILIQVIIHYKAYIIAKASMSKAYFKPNSSHSTQARLMKMTHLIVIERVYAYMLIYLYVCALCYTFVALHHRCQTLKG